MISRANYHGITWIDLSCPTREEALTIAEEFEVPMLVVEELIKPSIRSRVDVYPEFLYLILHFPLTNKVNCKNNKKISEDNIDEVEINFVLGKKYLLTAHYDKENPFDDFSKKFEQKSQEASYIHKNKISHAGYLFYEIVKDVYSSSLSELDKFESVLGEIETSIFENKENYMVEKISNINRHLLDFKKAIRFHGEVLKSFQVAGVDFFGKEFSYYLTAIESEYNQLKNVLENQRDILKDLRDTNDSLLSKKINATMRTLTVFSFLMMPIIVIAGIFGMNAKYMPIIGNPRDFWIILVLMTLSTMAILLIFIHKKWL